MAHLDFKTDLIGLPMSEEKQEETRAELWGSVVLHISPGQYYDKLPSILGRFIEHTREKIGS